MYYKSRIKDELDAKYFIKQSVHAFIILIALTIIFCGIAEMV